VKTSSLGVQALVRRRRTLLFVSAATWIILVAQPIFAAVDQAPCSITAASQQLDFWLGEWSVTYPGSSTPSTSRVSLELDSCLVVENWVGGKGHSGKNLFAYSADDQKWHGMFADNEGRVHVFEGKVSAESAEFYGPSRDAAGQQVVNRIKIVRINSQKVQQTWEKSTDGKTTWTTVFEGEYSRKSQ
jgi:hypothetical protein